VVEKNLRRGEGWGGKKKRTPVKRGSQEQRRPGYYNPLPEESKGIAKKKPSAGGGGLAWGDENREANAWNRRVFESSKSLGGGGKD